MHIKTINYIKINKWFQYWCFGELSGLIKFILFQYLDFKSVKNGTGKQYLQYNRVVILFS